MTKNHLFVLVLFIVNASIQAASENDLPDYFKTQNCNLHCNIVSYEGNKTIDTKSCQLNGNTMNVDFQGNKWQVRLQPLMHTIPVNEIEFNLSFKLVQGEASETGVNLEFAFSRWNVQNYVFVPGAVYNGNRFKVKKMEYPPFYKDIADYIPTVHTIINDIPHLKIDAGQSLIGLESGSMATPAFGFQSGNTGKGVLIFSQQQTSLGNLGFFIEENPTRDTAYFRLSAPCVRQWRPTISGLLPSADKAAHWKTGDSVTFHVRCYFFKAPAVTDLFVKFASVRKDGFFTKPDKQVLPYSEAFKILEEKYNTTDWNKDYGYTEGVGWCGGGMLTCALIAQGTSLSKQRAIKNLDIIVDKAIYPSGLPAEWRTKSFYVNKLGNNRLNLIRSSGDMFYFLQKQILLLKATDNTWQCPQKWLLATKKMADAFVTMWNRYGQFGQFFDLVSGEIVVGGSSAGNIVPAGLALASEIFHNKQYLEVARKSALFYYQRDILSGVTNGGPGEILQAPDSETAFNFVESLTVLYEVTNDNKWLQLARHATEQAASWVVSYNYKFPESSTFGKLGIRTLGSVYANAQNMSSTPGICTGSGDCLLKLFRATGDTIYIDLLKDIAHGIPQYLSTKERPIYAIQGQSKQAGIMAPGWMNERVNMGDWEINLTPDGKPGGWFVPQGEVFHGSTWAEASLMLTCAELPGIYIQPDKKLAVAFDNVEAEIIEQSKNVLKVKIANSTPYSATVKVLVENSAKAKQSVGGSLTGNCRIIVLKPYENKVFEW